MDDVVGETQQNTLDAGRRCWFCLYDLKVKSNSDWQAGIFKLWSTDYEHDDGQYIQFPVGVVESVETGLCHAVYANRVSFSDQPPQAGA